jgi:NAD(P)-dependent dehydrogenase (short-subunit alcohol dehydrogenase family)
MLAIRGANSEIAKKLIAILHPDTDFIAVGRDETTPDDADRYLFCSGLLRPKSLADQTDEEIEESFQVNCSRICQDCDRLIASNDRARICVIGSESAFSGSFDGAYVTYKRMLHAYVLLKKLRTPDQQLVCIAPSIIADAGMTLRRTDRDRLRARELRHPKKRFLTSEEVARWVYFVLYEDKGYLTNQIIRLNGGEHL